MPQLGEVTDWIRCGATPEERRLIASIAADVEIDRIVDRIAAARKTTPPGAYRVRVAEVNAARFAVRRVSTLLVGMGRWAEADGEYRGVARG